MTKLDCMRQLHGSYGKYALVDWEAARQSLGMDLYISPLSCSFAVHVVCLEADVPIKLHRVVRSTKLLEDGRDFHAIAPQAIVPAIGLPDGSVLTETAAVLQYIADLKPTLPLAPRWGTPERYRLIEWLHFVSTEVHKKHLFPVFSSKTSDAVKAYAASTAAPPFEHAARRLEQKPFLLGEEFTVADSYLYWALMVAPYGGIKVESPALKAYVARIRERASVKRALEIELPMYLAEKGSLPTAA